MDHPAFRYGIVLGARVRPDGAPSDALLRRTAHAVGLHRAGRVRTLVLCGGAVGAPVSEAAVMLAAALAAGLPREEMIVEDASRNTVENLVNARRLIGGSAGPVLVVSDSYHLPRALYVCRRLGIAAEGSAPPPPPSGHRLSLLLREAAAMPLTAWRSRLRANG